MQGHDGALGACPIPMAGRPDGLNGLFARG